MFDVRAGSNTVDLSLHALQIVFAHSGSSITQHSDTVQV